MKFVLILILTFFIGISLTPFLIHFAKRINLVDIPDNRKIHVGHIPLVGGLVVFVSGWVALFVQLQNFFEAAIIFFTSLLILIVGLYDDKKSLKVSSRVLAQFIAVLLVFLLLDIWLENLGNIFIYGDVIFEPFFGFILTFFAILGVTSSLNMSDGINGLAGSLALITLCFLSFLAYSADRFFEFWLASIFAVSLIPYLLFNMGFFGRKNRIFLGDSGAMFLGFIIALIFILLSQDTELTGRAINPVTALWIFCIPLVDTFAIMWRRLLEGKSPFLPDRNHLHHILMKNGISSNLSLFLIVVSSILLSSIGVFIEIIELPEFFSFFLFCLFFILYFFLMLFLIKKVDAKTK